MVKVARNRSTDLCFRWPKKPGAVCVSLSALEAASGPSNFHVHDLDHPEVVLSLDPPQEDPYFRILTAYRDIHALIVASNRILGCFKDVFKYRG